MAKHESPYDENQPMFDGFGTGEGLFGSIDREKQQEVASHIAAAAKGRLPFESRESEAYADLGGGRRETGTTETPRTRTPRHKPRPTGHVRDIEPRYSDLDPFWNTQSPRLSDEQRATNQKGAASAREALNRATAPARYDELQEDTVSQQQATLRSREERKGR